MYHSSRDPISQHYGGKVTCSDMQSIYPTTDCESIIDIPGDMQWKHVMILFNTMSSKVSDLGYWTHNFLIIFSSISRVNDFESHVVEDNVTHILTGMAMPLSPRHDFPMACRGCLEIDFLGIFRSDQIMFCFFSQLQNHFLGPFWTYPFNMTATVDGSLMQIHL